MTEEEVYFGAYNAAISGIMSTEDAAVYIAAGNLRRGDSAMDQDRLNAISAIAEQIAFKAIQIKLDLFK